MKKFIFIITIIAFIFSFADLFPHRAQAASENYPSDKYIEVAKSDFGIVYLDKENVQVFTKNDKYYLYVVVEEKYTDKELLQQLQQDQNERIQDAVSVLYIYLFTNDGAYYWVPNRYLIDSNGNVCSELSAIDAQAVNNDPILTKIYSIGLEVLEDNLRMQNMMNQ